MISFWRREPEESSRVEIKAFLIILMNFSTLTHFNPSERPLSKFPRESRGRRRQGRSSEMDVVKVKKECRGKQGGYKEQEC